ncbi:deoxyuridine 5'-triphosphate nucleotidohydrolase [Methanolobus halotolerans]|uniref:Probable deoxyuridine 5'-triphosphate nucleotidohydrolase n=1 Tax=Methanolobus halotolerans TaxID=2052935 RepID=A0A4E0Q0H8_9EURY|nr:deoxyuridine 5'-triphosphate nucleotidohydrolase [Methanolobus halotolerans]TGC09822.1 deoxyuridine 5'-triphosphate nucleotidohydrolase [Methanolobus halotolerans]
MTMLSRDELKDRINSKIPLVENMIDAETQLQPNSFELTLKSIELLRGAGAVDFDNSERLIPESEIIEFDSEGWAFLDPGTYKIRFNEIVNIPLDLAAIARPRSSLLRCGVTVESAVWDSGYKGRSESMLVVHSPHGFRVKKNARLLQLVFYSLHQDVSEGYCGRYQNENL